MNDKPGLSTHCVHGGELDDAHGSPHTPLYQTSTFKFRSTAGVLDVVEGRKPGSLYTRYGLNPTIFSLENNYPNPFNPETTIEFYLDEPCNVRLQIFDMTGHLVKTLANDNRAAGSYTVRWNAQDEYGTRVASGIYFYRITAIAATGETQAMTKRMTLLK